MKLINEAMKVHEEWYVESKIMTLEKLPDFLKKLTTEYEHDYGTICHAITASALAAMKAVDHSAQGGITGFQASCIMWEFIKRWMHYDSPLRLIIYKDMLYPQYEEKFSKIISKENWEWLKKEANKLLKENSAVPEVCDHWKSITDGNVPFGYIVKGESN